MSSDFKPRFCNLCYEFFRDAEKYYEHVAICGTPQAAKKPVKAKKAGNAVQAEPTDELEDDKPDDEATSPSGVSEQLSECDKPESNVPEPSEPVAEPPRRGRPPKSAQQ